MWCARQKREGLLHIRGEIYDAIDLPFAAVDAHGACVQVNGIPGEGTHLGDPQPTAQHEEENEPIADGVNDLKERDQIGIWDGFGQYSGCQEPMPSPQDRLLRHLAFFAEILKEARQETHFRINGRWGEASRLRGGNEGGDVVGGRLGEVRGEDDLALLGQLAEERGQCPHDGVERQARILTGGEVGQVLEDTVLIRCTEARKGRLIRGSREDNPYRRPPRESGAMARV